MDFPHLPECSYSKEVLLGKLNPLPVVLFCMHILVAVLTRGHCGAHTHAHSGGGPTPGLIVQASFDLE